MKLIKKYPIIENTEIADNIYRMKIYSPELCMGAQAGQFFHIRCGGEKFPLLRRPISLSYRIPEKRYVVMVYRIEGQGTQYLSTQKPGRELDIMGPLGRGFHVDPEYKKVMLVGGGMGIAPLVELARIYKDKSTALVGYRSKPFLKEELNKEAGEVLVASEDGSEGYKGFVTELLEKELGKLRPDLVYCCGPRPMMKRVVDICRSLSVGCQVSLEERMGCGIGACLVCSCATKGKDGGLVYSRVCKDGPVFWAEEVVLHG